MTKKSLKFKKHKTNRNSLLSQELVYTGNLFIQSHFKLLQFTSKGIESLQLNSFEEFKQKRKEGSVCWLNVKGLSDVHLMEEIRGYFGLQVLEMQNILNTHNIPKVQEYEHHMLVVLKAFSTNQNQELQKEHLCFVLGADFLLTFQETDNVYFDNIRKAFVENTVNRKNISADYILSLLIRNICDNYTDYLVQIEDALEEMESDLMDFSNTQKDIGWKIQFLRKKYLSLKKTILPFKESFGLLLKQSNDLLRKENLAFFNDSYNHLLIATQKVEACREMLSSLLDLYVSNNDLRMNTIMKRLTIVGTIFIPLTFVVGVWGMNFDNMPELKMKYGYYYAWGIMLLVGLFSWMYIKFKKWD